jgi:hypothetical protein
MDHITFLQRQAARHSGPLNWVLNHFRTVVRRVEFSDPYGQGEASARLWHVATCRKCGLTCRSVHPVDITLFDIEHTRHPHDDKEVKAA